MSIDVFREQVLNLSDAAKRLPRRRNGKSPHVSTNHRWVTRGKRGPDGAVVRLEIVRIGGTTCTSLEALQRFFDRLTGELAVSPSTATMSERMRQIRQANEELDRAGI